MPKRPPAGDGSPTAERITNRDDCVRQFWARLMGVEVDNRGSVPGFDAYYSALPEAVRRSLSNLAEAAWHAVKRYGWHETVIETRLDTARRVLTEGPHVRSGSPIAPVLDSHGRPVIQSDRITTPEQMGLKLYQTICYAAWDANETPGQTIPKVQALLSQYPWLQEEVDALQDFVAAGDVWMNAEEHRDWQRHRLKPRRVRDAFADREQPQAGA